MLKALFPCKGGTAPEWRTEPLGWIFSSPSGYFHPALEAWFALLYLKADGSEFIGSVFSAEFLRTSHS